MTPRSTKVRNVAQELRQQAVQEFSDRPGSWLRLNVESALPVKSRSIRRRATAPSRPTVVRLQSGASISRPRSVPPIDFNPFRRARRSSARGTVSGHTVVFRRSRRPPGFRCSRARFGDAEGHAGAVGCSMPSAAPSALPPSIEDQPERAVPWRRLARGRQRHGRRTNLGHRSARCSSRRTCSHATAPAAPASWHARCPTPPEAPSTKTLRPSSNPPWRRACSAVSPATGRVWWPGRR